MDSLTALILLMSAAGVAQLAWATLLVSGLVQPRWFGSSASGSALLGSAELVGAALLAAAFILHLDFGNWLFAGQVVVCGLAAYGLWLEKSTREGIKQKSRCSLQQADILPATVDR